MVRPPRASWTCLPLLALSILPARVLAGDVLSTDGFTTCLDNATISVNNMDLTYTRSTRVLNFDVSGSSSEEQKVMASITVSAYGISVYSKTFDPCDSKNYVEDLCPGRLAAESFNRNLY